MEVVNALGVPWSTHIGLRSRAQACVCEILWLVAFGVGFAYFILFVWIFRGGFWLLYV